MNKQQRRNHFILSELEQRAHTFAEETILEAVSAPLEIDQIEQIRAALMAAFIAGAGAALDAEDGKSKPMPEVQS